jgi:hypothetical protein|tara:strand:- start:707 stop:934 length:228 start_codon:yes stop_codon:yes gene_type:complete
MIDFGWIGLSILLLSWLSSVTKYSYVFYITNTLASWILTVHAFMIMDVPFIIVNGFIGTITTYHTIKQYRGSKNG